MTDPSHPDFTNLETALKQVNALSVEVNETMQKQEAFNQLCKLEKQFTGLDQSFAVFGRKLIKEGPLTKVCRFLLQQPEKEKKERKKLLPF